MRASARERAHIGTLTSRSVENVKSRALAAGRRSRFIGLGSRLRQKILASPRGLGPKLRRGWGAVRQPPGCAGRRLRSDPLNLAGHAR